MGGLLRYGDAVQAIKQAILKSQYEAVKGVNAQQLALYYSIGGYISVNTRTGTWGKDAISSRLQEELPGLRGFSARNLKYMRTFYEEWSQGAEDNPALSSAGLGGERLAEIRQ